MKEVKRDLELPVKCIKCEMDIECIDLPEDIKLKKGGYANDMMGSGCGCIDKGIAPGILVELINPSLVSFSSEEEYGKRFSDDELTKIPSF